MGTNSKLPTGKDSVTVAEMQKSYTLIEAFQEAGRRGGHARAASLSSARRKAIAKKAAETRWKGRQKKMLDTKHRP